MGQIFNATIYDIDNFICSSIDSDKFQANCYSFSGSVAATHYLLRQKPYRVMWLGHQVIQEDVLNGFSREEDLYGLSTYLSKEIMEKCIEDLENKSCFSKVKFIGENHNRWNFIKVWDEAIKLFDLEYSHTVNYSGYLLNHTKKIAVDLHDYYNSSVCANSKGLLYVMDLIPFLTETGGVTLITLFGGISANTTEKLSRTWCGDLLQIVEDLPTDYKLMNYCFAEMFNKAYMYHDQFGVDKDNFVLQDDKGTRFTSVQLNIHFNRSPLINIKTEQKEHAIKYSTVFLDK
jgi:hypothetical protein